MELSDQPCLQSSMDDIFVRHVVDLHRSLLGSSGRRNLGPIWEVAEAFLVLVVGVLAAEKTPELKIVLVESDHANPRFCALRRNSWSCKSTSFRKRSRLWLPIGANVVSARALAPLPQLCAYVSRHISMDGIAPLHGCDREGEITAARQRWRFRMQQIQAYRSNGCNPRA